MRKFVLRFLRFLIIFILCFEILSRLFIDTLYFNSIDTYNLKTENNIKDVFILSKTNHVDYLFIGSSRVPATINPDILMNIDTGKVAVVAGRGYMTAGIHLQALKNKIKKYPQYLSNSNVFIEYPGSSIYVNALSDELFAVHESNENLEKGMPHLLLPHLDIQSLREYLIFSPNSRKTKREMLLLYFSSAYRTMAFIKEKFKTLDKPILSNSGAILADEGGIRNDNIDFAIQKAIDYAITDSIKIENAPNLTFESLNNSVLSSLHQLIIQSGGKLYLYKMPLHSIQEKTYDTRKSKLNQEIFEKWLKTKNISVLHNTNFYYNDNDFPDTWHLSKNKRDDFTSLLYEAFLSKNDTSANINTSSE